MTDPSQKGTCHQDAEKKQGKYLLGEAPCGAEPLLSLFRPRGQHYGKPYHTGGEGQFRGRGEYRGNSGYKAHRKELPHGGPEPADQNDPQQNAESGNDLPLHLVKALPDTSAVIRGEVGEHQYSHHGGEVDRRFPQGSSFTGGALEHIRRLSFPFVPAEDEMHEKTNDDTEDNSAHRPGHTQLDSQHPGGKDNGKNVYRRAGV